MALSDADHRLIESFRDRVETRFRSDGRFAGVTRDDRDDQALLASRLLVAPGLWLEVVVRPFIPQVRAGILTDDRWRNEDLEDKIEESGDTMSEFVELGFFEAGLEWKNPPVEHYREQGRFFCFSTGFEVPALAALGSPETFDRVCRMVEGYFEAFKPVIQKAAAGT